jgi:hypothetical protein
MKPATARVAMIVITLTVVIAGVVVVDSFYNGSFAAGLLLPPGVSTSPAHVAV